MTDAFIESRSSNRWLLCHWKTNRADNTGGYVHPAIFFTPNTNASDRSGFEIVVTSVTLEQESLTSPIKLTFRTTHKTPVENETSLSSGPMVMWRDCLIAPYIRARNRRTYGLFLWSLRDNATFYFTVRHRFFPRLFEYQFVEQMSFVPHYIKVCDDLLFVKLEITGSSTTYRCLHIPTLVLSTQLPDGSLDLTEKVFSELPPECRMETYTAGSIGSVGEEIYSIPSCRPTHPRYCFVLNRVLERSAGMDWEVLEVEIDPSIPGPIKIFSQVSRQYTVPRPNYFFHDGEDDLLLYLPSEYNRRPCAPLRVRFLRVGKPDHWRVVKLGGMNKMRLAKLHVDKDAGYIIAWVLEGCLWWKREYSFIWWVDERRSGLVIDSAVESLIPEQIRRLLWCF